MSAVWILGAGPAWSRRALRPVIVLGVALVLAGCTTRPAPPPAARPPELRSPVDAVTVLDATTPAELALTTSRTFFTAAPVVVLAADGDPAGQDGAARTATGLGAPLLLTPPDASGTSSTALGAELRRLGTTDVVAAGAAAGWARAAGAGVTVHDPADPPANPRPGRPETDPSSCWYSTSRPNARPPRPPDRRVPRSGRWRVPTPGGTWCSARPWPVRCPRTSSHWAPRSGRPPS